MAILIGVLLGHFYPGLATKMKPLGDAFIKLIKMMIAPIIFTTVVVGIAKVSDMKEVGRVGLKAIVYFELVSTLALAIGLVVVNVVKPGVGINADVTTLDASAVSAYTSSAKAFSAVEFFTHRIPTPLWERSPAEKSFKSWFSRSFLVWGWRALEKKGSNWSTSSINSLTLSSA